MLFSRKKKLSHPTDLRGKGLHPNYEEHITDVFFQKGFLTKHTVPSFLSVNSYMLYGYRAVLREYAQCHGENALIDALVDVWIDLHGKLDHPNILCWGAANGYHMREIAMFSIFPICESITTMVFQYNTLLMSTALALQLKKPQVKEDEYVLDYVFEPWFIEAIQKLGFDISRNTPFIEKGYIHSPIWQYDRMIQHAEQCPLCRTLLKTDKCIENEDFE